MVCYKAYSDSKSFAAAHPLLPSSSGQAAGASAVDGVAAALGQRAELLEGERAAAAALGNVDAGPQPLGAGHLARLPRAQPATRTCPAHRLGLVIGCRHPPFGVLRTCTDLVFGQ